jgi:hypothetical protein
MLLFIKGILGAAMGMVLKIIPEPGLLHVLAAGEFSLEEAKTTFLEILDAVLQYGSQKILFDLLQLKGEPEIMERFYYGEFAAMETRKLIKCGYLPKFAYLCTAPLCDPHKFGETVAVNLGMNVKTFDNLEEASKWLML